MENEAIPIVPIITKCSGVAVRPAPAANSGEAASLRPRGRPFPPGQSGNPRGRPQRDHDVAELARTHTVAAIATLVAVMQDTGTPPSARITAASVLLDRGWGKAPQSLDLRHEMNLSAEFERFIRELGAARHLAR